MICLYVLHLSINGSVVKSAFVIRCEFHILVIYPVSCKKHVELSLRILRVDITLYWRSKLNIHLFIYFTTLLYISNKRQTLNYVHIFSERKTKAACMRAAWSSNMCPPDNCSMNSSMIAVCVWDQVITSAPWIIILSTGNNW